MYVRNLEDAEVFGAIPEIKLQKRQTNVSLTSSHQVDIDGVRGMSSHDIKTNETKISCRNLWKVYGQHPERYFKDNSTLNDPGDFREHLIAKGLFPAVSDISFDVHVGEIFVIMGLSGSGKSTVLRCISRLIEPTAGEVIIDGRNFLDVSERELIKQRRHKMGMVFQHFGLLPHLSVFENIAFPLKLQGIPSREYKKRIAQVIELVGLEGKETSFPKQLSGGQQQRVGIARSLCTEPELWFLDEPFSALDPLIRKQMQDEFLRLQKKLNKTILFITHDIMEAMRLGDRIAIMKDGQLVQIGTPQEIISHPANSYVEEFTKDVPKTRIIRARDLIAISPPEENRKPVETSVPEDMALEEILCRFKSPEGRINVVDDYGKVLGSITVCAALKALANCKD